MKNLQKFILILLVLFTLFSYKNLNNYFNIQTLDFTKVIADDDEDDEEEQEDKKEEEREEEEEEHRSSEDNTPTPNKEEFAPKTQVNEEPKITYKEETYTEYVTITDADYAKDSDGDKLVDAIDPDPKRSQLDFFTDNDMDGIPNIYDAFDGKNDFLYLGNSDENNNGIIDSYE